MAATPAVSTIPPYTVQAYNLSHASENKIHDDTIAKQLGFTGGLVPGVEVYAYMTHPVVGRWGRQWLERGRLECRLLKPVYDGRPATVTARADGDALTLEVASDGIVCATGRASLGPADEPAPALADYAAPPPVPALAARPPADQRSLATGTCLGIVPVRVTPEIAAAYLRDVREIHPLYAAEGLVHPGTLLRLCNAALKDNVALPPWIHTGSKVRNLAAGRVGDELTVRARIVDNYERKGHRLVDVDVLIVANGERILAQVLHTAVYQLRQLAPA